MAVNDWIETGLFVAAAIFFAAAWVRGLRPYRSLFLGSFVLWLSTALYRQRAVLFGLRLHPATTVSDQLPGEIFGIAWGILGAWLVRSLLKLVLRRTFFPNDDQPHAKRLFADLASVLVYVVAFVGIMDTVLKEPVSAVLATSGVLAIVLGLALQNTLADVFSGLAINIERPFGAGDWITLSGNVEGQVIEINWRATRLRTQSNDSIVVPNSVIAKAIVTNHRRLNQARLCTLRLQVDQSVSPVRVLELLRSAAAASAGIAASPTPSVDACEFVDAAIAYEIYFGVENFVQSSEVQSAMISRITESLHAAGIQIGPGPWRVAIMPRTSQAAVPKPMIGGAAATGSSAATGTEARLPAPQERLRAL